MTFARYFPVKKDMFSYNKYVPLNKYTKNFIFIPQNNKWPIIVNMNV